MVAIVCVLLLCYRYVYVCCCLREQRFCRCPCAIDSIYVLRLTWLLLQVHGQLLLKTEGTVFSHMLHPLWS